jgi:thiol peroxidase
MNDIRIGAALAGVLGLAMAAGCTTSNKPATRGNPLAQEGKPMVAQTEARSVTMKGQRMSLAGADVAVGQAAPDATLTGNDMKEVKLSSYRGKVVILSSVPSLDTAVCSRETHRFNQEAAGLGDNIAILTISMDLPFAQKRWCGAEGVDKVVTLSDHKDASFGKAYGVLMPDIRLLARAVYVVDRAGVIRYKQVVPEIGQEPDYEPVLAAARKLAR